MKRYRKLISLIMAAVMALMLVACDVSDPANTQGSDPSTQPSQSTSTTPTDPQDPTGTSEATDPSTPSEPDPTDSQPTDPTPTESQTPPTEDTTPTEPETSGIEFVTWPKTISRNEQGTVTIKGQPNTTYSIKVYYKSGASTAKGLEDKVSDADGYVTWTWKVGAKTSAGNFKIVVTGGGDSETVEYSVVE